MDVLQTLLKKLKTVVCRPILHHGFPIQSKSIVKQLRQNITVTTLKLTDVGSRSIVGSYVPVKEMSVNDI